MTQPSRVRRMLAHDLALLAGLALFKLLLHFCLNGRYGYMRDELYFIDCGMHLDWGYVDIGPLTPWLGRLMRWAMGDTLFALRFTAALAGAATVFLTGWLTRYLGGGRWAQALAALSVIIAPVWLQTGNILSLPSHEPVLWMSCICLMAVIFKTGRTRLWLAVGVVAGIGLLNKPSMAFFGFGLLLGLMLTPQRKQLRENWLWLGGLLALLVAMPNLIWQAQNDWPTWEFVHGLNRDLMARIPRWLFLLGQVVYQHPLNVPIWLAGLAWLFFAGNGKPYRTFGFVFLAVFLLLFTAKSKIYYLAPAFPVLLAAGALAIEDRIRRRNGRWAKTAIPAALILGGAVTAPIGLPVLPIEQLDRYVRTITFGALGQVYEVTGTWHDQFGWENQVETVARVFRNLPPEDRQDCMILVSNFGEAGAIGLFGKAYGLPGATSTHQNYFLWGPAPVSGNLAIAYGLSREMADFLFADVAVADTIHCAECMPFENNRPVYVCRKPKIALKKAWPEFRIIAFSNVGVTRKMGARLTQKLEKYRI